MTDIIGEPTLQPHNTMKSHLAALVIIMKELCPTGRSQVKRIIIRSSSVHF